MNHDTENDGPIVKAEPVEVQPATKPQSEFPEIRKSGLNLHPMSGLLILFLDYSLFVAEMPILTLPLAVTLGFLLSFIGVFLIQKYIDEESTGRAVAKAFFAGVVTGIPTPIFGTVFGSLILVISGLSFLKNPFKK